MKNILVIISLILIASISNAASLYVSPTGSGVACTEGSPCTLRTANAAVAAGDTVYMMTGTYAHATSGPYCGICPATTGTAEAKITYTKYTDAAPVVTLGDDNYGALVLNNVDYIVIDGITFHDNWRWGYIMNGADYNEVKNCTFYNTTKESNQGLFIFGYVSGSDYSNGSTHNWIHHNTFYNLYLPPCSEGGDIVRIGSASAGDSTSNYNTIEYNTFYHAGHTLYDQFTHYNVIRGNVGWNDGFKTDIAHVTGTATGGGSTSMINTAVNFGTACGGATCAGYVVHDLSDENAYGPLAATITSVSTTTNANDTINFSSGSGTPTFANGHNYDISCRYWVDDDPPSNGKYGHRCFHIDSHARDGNDYNLFEGNRAGHSAPNPGNNGLDGLSLSSGHNILRYNSYFGNGGPGLYFKNGAAASNNRVYNETIYGNGRFSGEGDPVSPVITAGIYGTSSATGNVIKNTILYGNTSQVQCSSCVVTTGGNLCESAHDWCASTGNPLFADTDITTPASSATLPDFTLASNSPAINAGTWLTQVNDADGCDADSADCTELVVDDATYFQDGTWGSSLSSISPDEICISASSSATDLARCKAISSINYATNTITLASEITFANNEYVWLYKKSDGAVVLVGTAPDVGAHEYAGGETPSATWAVTNTAGTGCVHVPSDNRDVIKAEQLSVAITPAYGYSIVSVTGCGGTWGTTPYEVTPTENCTITSVCKERRITGIGTGSGSLTIGGTGTMTLGN